MLTSANLARNLSVPVLLALCFNSLARDVVVEDPESCAAINGAWINAGEPELGRCTLQRNLKLGNGDTLIIPAGVTLIVTNATLDNAGGAIYISDYGVLRISRGVLVNSGVIDVEDDGILRLADGYIDNSGVIATEGAFEVFSNTTVYNTGTLRNYSGGDVISHGVILVYQNAGTCEINNEAGGTITNRNELYILDRCQLTNDDAIINRTTSELLVAGMLSNRAGGTIENSGVIFGQSGQLVNEDGSVTNQNGGQIWTYGTTQLTNRGNGTITNKANSLIRITAPSTVANQGSAVLDNQANARIFVDDGSLANESIIHNSGSIENDLTNNVNGGITGRIVNTGAGVVDNQASGVISNPFGIFENDATVNNGGAFWTCFGRYTGSGQFSGNAIQSCLPTPNFPTPPKFP